MDFIWTGAECKILFITWLLNAILLPSKFVYFNENVHCCHGVVMTLLVSHEIITCGHNIVYAMRLSNK